MTDKESAISLSVVVLCTGTPNARLAQYPTTPTSSVAGAPIAPGVLD
jgi:hypothetical protein